MKKMLLLAMVLGLATAASASAAAAPGTLELVISSLNGNPIAPTKEITIVQSDTVNMDIVYTGNPGWNLYAIGFRITASGGPGALDVDSMTYDPEWDLAWEIIDEEVAGRQVTIEESAKDLGIEAADPAAGIVVLDHILFHCDGRDDVTITVADLDPGEVTYTQEVNWNTGSFQPLTWDTAGVTIHQVPEPMTLSLLGLGGLALLRRRRS